MSEPNPVGRPSLYDPAHCEVAERLLGEGFSMAVVAGEIGVCRDTVFEWAKEHPEFSDAVKRGRAKGAHIWEARLAKLADSGVGNATAIIFGLKNRQPDEWRDKTETEHSGRVVTECEWRVVDPQA